VLGAELRTVVRTHSSLHATRHHHPQLRGDVRSAKITKLGLANDIILMRFTKRTVE